MPPRRLGPVQEEVLYAVASGHRYGFDLMDAAALSSGAVYQALAALERAGYVRSRWEHPDIAERGKRPRRRYYAITGAGKRALADAAERRQAVTRRVPAPGKEEPDFGAR